MNLKEEISKFRSQLLIGRYDSALKMGKNIMAQIQVFKHLKLLKDDRLLTIVQEQYEKCLAIKAIINRPYTNAGQQVKKWGGKPKDSKWKKKEEIKIEIQEVQSSKFEQNNSSIKVLMDPQYVEIIQNLQKQIMMPIKMPVFFKQKKSLLKIIKVPLLFFPNVLSFFIDNDFMTIDYQAFCEQFSKNPQENFFYDSNTTQILIDCNLNPPQSLKNIFTEPQKYSKFNCVFLLAQGQKNQSNDLI